MFMYMDLAICDPLCENGGICTQERTCHCAPGYEGPLCEEGIIIIIGTDHELK